MSCYKPSLFKLKTIIQVKGAVANDFLNVFCKKQIAFFKTEESYIFVFLITTENSSTEAIFTLQYLKVTKLSYKH